MVDLKSALIIESAVVAFLTKFHESSQPHPLAYVALLLAVLSPRGRRCQLNLRPVRFSRITVVIIPVAFAICGSLYAEAALTLRPITVAGFLFVEVFKRLFRVASFAHFHGNS